MTVAPTTNNVGNPLTVPDGTCSVLFMETTAATKGPAMNINAELNRNAITCAIRGMGAETYTVTVETETDTVTTTVTAADAAAAFEAVADTTEIVWATTCLFARDADGYTVLKARPVRARFVTPLVTFG